MGRGERVQETEEREEAKTGLANENMLDVFVEDIPAARRAENVVPAKAGKGAAKGALGVEGRRSKPRRALGALSKSALNSRGAGGLDAFDGEKKKAALGAKPRANKLRAPEPTSVAESKAAAQIERSVPKEVGPARDLSGLGDTVVSPTDVQFRKNVRQEAILSNAECVSGSGRESIGEEVRRKALASRNSALPTSPTDAVFRKNLRKEAILLSARECAEDDAVPVKSGRGGASRRLPPSPADLQLHKDLRREAISLNARRVAHQDGVQNLVSKFESA